MLESTFGIVVFGAVGFSIVVCVVILFTHGGSYDSIGAEGLTRDSESFGGGMLDAPVESAAGRAEQEREVRQMLTARSERQVSRGEPALDIDAEVARLLGPERAPQRSAGIEEEVRQLVVAKNERRERRGLEPLDVDAEVARTLQELGA